MALKLAASERSSVGPPGGTRRSRSSSSATLEATVRSRRSGRSTRSAASHAPTAAASSATSPSGEQPAVERGLAVAPADASALTISSRASPPRPLSRSVVT